jgi:hypothetical protein
MAHACRITVARRQRQKRHADDNRQNLSIEHLSPLIRAMFLTVADTLMPARLEFNAADER